MTIFYIYLLYILAYDHFVIICCSCMVRDLSPIIWHPINKWYRIVLFGTISVCWHILQNIPWYDKESDLKSVRVFLAIFSSWVGSIFFFQHLNKNCPIYKPIRDRMGGSIWVETVLYDQVIPLRCLDTPHAHIHWILFRWNFSGTLYGEWKWRVTLP